MAHYDGDDLIKFANYEPPAGLELSSQRPFFYAEFETPVDRETQFHMHYAMELGVVTEGSMERFFADDRRKLGWGSIWMTSLLEPHWWRILEPGTRIAVFHILPEFLATLSFKEAPHLRLMAPFTAPHAFRPRSTARNRPQFLNLVDRIRALPRNELTFIRLRLILEEFLILLQEDWTPPPGKPLGGASFERLASAVELVFETPHYITSSEAAKACGLGRNRFHQLFMQHMGISFSDFALRHRLSSVAHELRHSQEPVKAIAERWGFSDVSHLHRIFTELYRCSPSAYRRDVFGRTDN